MRVLGATSDLHAADSQYHKCEPHTQAAQYKCNVTGEQGHAFQSVIEVMNTDNKTNMNLD